MGRHPYRHRMEARRDRGRDGGVLFENQVSGPGQKAFSGQVIQVCDIGNGLHSLPAQYVYDQRIPPGPPLHRKNFGHSGGVQGIARQSINGFRRAAAMPPAAK